MIPTRYWRANGRPRFTISPPDPYHARRKVAKLPLTFACASSFTSLSREAAPRIGVCRQSMATRASRLPEQGRRLGESGRVRAGIRNVVFPVSVRGYDRRAVDAYIIWVNRVIAELEATRSPERAVKRALERAEARREGILEQARERAAEIIAAARREAGAITAKARAEAVDIVVDASADADRTKAEIDTQAAKARIEAETILANSRTEAADQLRRAQEEIGALREEAEAWARELRADTETIWGERRELVDDLREIAARLQKAASDAAAREVGATVPRSDQ
jgi:DivIVA domain-containing protein